MAGQISRPDIAKMGRVTSDVFDMGVTRFVDIGRVDIVPDTIFSHKRIRKQGVKKEGDKKGRGAKKEETKKKATDKGRDT